MVTASVSVSGDDWELTSLSWGGAATLAMVILAYTVSLILTAGQSLLAAITCGVNLGLKLLNTLKGSFRVFRGEKPKVTR